MKLSQLAGNTPCVVMTGMCKNAGKTTAMNSLISEMAGDSRVLALTSIGRDGESRDLVTGTDKPAIYICEGMLAATADSLLALSDVSREILDVTGIYTSMGQVVVFRARSDGFVQLAGPSIVDQMSRLRRIFASSGAQCTVIDGALSRRSPTAAAKDGVCILSTGASLDCDINTVVDETAFVAGLMTLPERTAGVKSESKFTLICAGEAKGFDDAGELFLSLKKREQKEAEIYCRGAFTESHAAGLLKSVPDKEGIRITAEDGSKYLMKSGSFGLLKAHGVSFSVESGARLAAITVNPYSAGGWSFDAGEFLDKMSARVNVPVLDVKAK